MKRVSLLLAAVMISVVSFAQISWDVKAGVNMSTFSGVEGGDFKMKFGYQVGVGMEYAFTDMWSIQPSLLFITKGAKTDFSEDGYKLETSANPMYLQLPIMGAARFAVSDGVNLVVNAGPYLAYGIGGKSKFTETDEGEKEEEKGDVFGKDGADRFDFGLGAGVKAEFGKFVLGLDASFGLVKMYDDGPKNQTYALTLGYKF